MFAATDYGVLPIAVVELVVADAVVAGGRGGFGREESEGCQVGDVGGRHRRWRRRRPIDGKSGRIRERGSAVRDDRNGQRGGYSVCDEETVFVQAKARRSVNCGGIDQTRVIIRVQNFDLRLIRMPSVVATCVHGLSTTVACHLHLGRVHRDTKWEPGLLYSLAADVDGESRCRGERLGNASDSPERASPERHDRDRSLTARHSCQTLDIALIDPDQPG